MATIDYDAIEMAFLFVNAGPKFTNRAILAKETGQIYYLSGLGDSDPLPEDVDDPDRYVQIPHAHDLDLGIRLVEEFIFERLPEYTHDMAQIFRHKGAYRRYKNFLESKGMLEEWYQFEKERTKSALKRWCAENGIQLAGEGDEGEKLDGPRALRADEFDALMDLIDDTFRGPDWPRPTHAKLYSLLLNPATNLEGMRVFVQSDRPIAHFGFYVRDISCGGATLKLASVGSVCTHPDFRGQGLATRLFEDAIRVCKAQGVHLMLISGGRGLYRRQGAVDVGEMCTLALAPGEIEATGRIDLETWSNAVLPLCAAMYQREPFRFYRSQEDWQRVVRSGSDMNRGAQTFLIREDGIPCAYATVYAPEKDESGYLEYAGSRHTLWHAIPEFIERLHLRRFLLSVPAYDSEWASLSVGRKAKMTTISDHTARLIDVQGLWSALQPYLIERLGETGARIRCSEQPPYQIRWGQEQIYLPDIGILTQLVLGPHAPTIAELLQNAGELGENLRLAFPLPFGFPGLNFV